MASTMSPATAAARSWSSERASHSTRPRSAPPAPPPLRPPPPAPARPPRRPPPRKYCRDHFLSYVRLRDWHDTHGQLLEAVKLLGARLNAAPADNASLHRALLAGVLSDIGMMGESQEYRVARGIKFLLFPGSSV